MTSSASPPASASNRSILLLGLAGSLLCYLAHPPVGGSMLAWIGPAPWLLIARIPVLPTKRPYLILWLAGVAYWLPTIQWLRLPHWANHFALAFVAAYLGLYLPLFIGLVRVAVHRFRAPLWLAGPIVWTGFEWLRARLLTGFLMASLAHTQVDAPLLIQIADLGGEYAVTFLIMLVAAAAAESLPLAWVKLAAPPAAPSVPRRRRRPLLRPLGIALMVMLAVAYYGHTRFVALASQAKAGAKQPPRVALIQSDMLADWKGTRERDRRVMAEQYEMSLEAVRSSSRPVDVVIWPETMYRDPLWTIDADDGPPRHLINMEKIEATPRALAEKARELNAALLFGIDRANLVAPGADEPPADGQLDADDVRFDVYNAVVAVDRSGKLLGTYEKMHLLPFGEYTPFSEWITILQQVTPVTGNSLPGREPAAFELDGVIYAPNICYETVLPHLIRRQFTTLFAERSVLPDVMVNVTNDAWYWGSSELDMHLASGVFRAVEMRTPLVIAANRGLSGYIDYHGRRVQVSQRNQADALVVDVVLPPRRGAYPSFYASWGDWLPLSCLILCIPLAAIGWRDRRRQRHTPSAID